MADRNEKGISLRLSPGRRFIGDLVHFAGQVPSIPVARTMQLGAVADSREAADPRPSWTAVFLKAYGLVAREHAVLRRALVGWPWRRLYEHPHSVAGVAIERDVDDEPIVLGTQIRGPENQPLESLDAELRRSKTVPVSEIGYFRRALLMGKLPRPVRRLLWWMTLNLSGYKRAKRLGTFTLSSFGSLGAEQLHPISPLTTLLTFGPVSVAGEVVVKIIYDHRVTDGAEIARCLADLEKTLCGEIRMELDEMADPRCAVSGRRPPTLRLVG